MVDDADVTDQILGGVARFFDERSDDLESSFRLSPFAFAFFKYSSRPRRRNSSRYRLRDCRRAGWFPRIR